MRLGALLLLTGLLTGMGGGGGGLQYRMSILRNENVASFGFFPSVSCIEFGKRLQNMSLSLISMSHVTKP